MLDGHVMTEEEAQFFVSLVPVLACIHLGHASCDDRHGTSKGMVRSHGRNIRHEWCSHTFVGEQRSTREGR